MRKNASRGSSAQWTAITALALAAITVAVYLPALQGRFLNYDDIDYVTSNRHVQAGVTTDGIRWAFTTYRASNWHPLTWLSLMADTQTYGSGPLGYHLTNLLLHLLNTLLLFWLLVRLTGSVWKSGFVAALFAVHPLHVESVAWVSERKDLLSTLFWLLAIWAYAGYAKARSAGRYLLVMLLFALGLMAKPMLVTLPVTLLILDWWPLSRVRQASDWKRLIVEKLPLFALSAASATVTVYAQQAGGAVRTIEQFPLGVRAMNAAVACADYLWKAVWPAKLSVFYPHPGPALGLWLAVAAGLVLAAISVVVVGQRRARPYLFAGWLWYLVTLAPVIGLVQVGGQAMADRYTYVPLLGPFVAVVWLLVEAVERGGGRLRVMAAAAGVCALVVLSIVATRQVRVWHDSETLFRHALAVTQNNYTAENNLGVELVERGRLEEAKSHFRKALTIRKDYLDAHVSMASALLRQERVDEALPHLRAALRIAPQDTDALNNYGVALAMQEKLEESIVQFEAAIRANSESADAVENLKRARSMLAEQKSGQGKHDAAQ